MAKTNKRKSGQGSNSFVSVKQQRKFKVVGQGRDQNRPTEKQGNTGASKRKEALLSAISPSTRVNTFQDRRSAGLDPFQPNTAFFKESGRRARKSKFSLGEEDDGYQDGFNKGDVGIRQAGGYSGKRGPKMDFFKKQKMLKVEKRSEKDSILQKTENLDNEMDDIRSLMNFAHNSKNKSIRKKEQLGGDADYDDLLKRFESASKGVNISPKESQDNKIGGFAQKRQSQKEFQMKQGDQLGVQERREKLSKLECRHRERAAGDDPLQQSFRGAAAQLLAKYAISQKQEVEGMDDEEKDESDNDFDEEQDVSDNNDEEEDISDDEEEEVLKFLIQKKLSAKDSNMEKDILPNNLDQLFSKNSEKKEDHTGGEQQKVSQSQLRTRNFSNEKQELKRGTDSRFMCVPKSYQEFYELIQEKQKEQQSLCDIINRIRQECNEDLMRDNRQTLEHFYSYIIQLFYQLAEQNKLYDMNTLLDPIQQITTQIQLQACSVAREKILSVSKEASKGDFPTHADLHMFKLWMTLFEFNESGEHCVLDALYVLFGQILSTVKIRGLKDIETGLLMVFLGSSLCVKGDQNFWPEARLFLLKCLASMLPFNFNLWLTYCPEKSWLWIDPQEKIKDDQNQLKIELFGRDAVEDTEYKLSLINSLLRLVLQFVETNSGASSPEIFIDFKLCLEQLQQHCVQNKDLQDKVQDIIQKIVSYNQLARKALNQNRFKTAPSIRQHTPKFDFDEGDDDEKQVGKQRAQQRRLRRKVVKEERQAMRALRKDSAYVLDVREKQKFNAAEERDKKAKRAISFLQAQESDFRSGGQAGMNPHLKKKK